MAKLPGSDPASPRSSSFTPEVLDKTVIAIPLLKILEEERDEETKARKAHKRYIPRLIGVILDLNLEYRQGRDSCRQRVRELVAEAIVRAGTNKASGTQGINNSKSDLSNQYMFAKLEPSVIRELVRLDNQREVTDEQHGETDEQRTTWMTQRAIYRIWPDFKIKKLTTKSVSTVKADAARVSFSAFGDEVVWAVIDSGIDGRHPHFESHQNLELKEPLRHRDFTADEHEEEQPLVDEFGHGTHVAGIIAGEMSTDANKRGDAETPKEIRAVTRHRDEFGELERTNTVKKIFHVAAVVGQVGKGYSPIPDITECVRNAIETADDSEYDDADLKTMLLPLLGTGTGRGELERRARELIYAAISHMERHPPCRIQRVYFLSWTERDLAVCQRILQESPEVTIP